MKILFTVADIAMRYQCSKQTARTYIRRMTHMENPLAVYEEDLMDWERSRMQYRSKARKIIPRSR